MESRRKELIQQYKERKITGGIYLIKNSRGGKSVLGLTTDIQGSRNRFDFSKKTGMCTDKRIENDWKRLGADAYSFDVLEEISKKETQTDREFERDLADYKELWREHLSGKGEIIA
ncbi:MAG: GIY-YIG nuclease family protein [Synergistaceae bacterium]|nr:GIY-YIG nuclease family protein [Synergistaceae bacterium]